MPHEGTDFDAYGRPGDVRASGALKVFISYSRADVAFADELELALRDKGHIPLIDRHGIDAGEAWRDRLGELILQSDTVVFVLTETSASSPICAWEVEEAARMGKRILVATPGPVPTGVSLPPQLKAINWIHCWRNPDLPGSSLVRGFLSLDGALRTNLGWLRQRTVYQEQANSWTRRGSAADSPILLRADLLAEALAWARGTPPAENIPEEVARFLAASEAHEASLKATAEASVREREDALIAAEAAAARAKAAAEGEIAEAVRRQHVQKRFRTFAIIATVVSSSLTLGALGAGWYAWTQQNIANGKRQEAEQNFVALDGLVLKLTEEMKDTDGISAEAMRRVLAMASATLNDLTIANPHNLEILGSRAHLLMGLGNNFRIRGNISEALASFREARDIFEQLALKDSEEARWRSGLAGALTSIGDVQIAQGDLSAASASYMESLALTRRLAGIDPNNASWQRDLLDGLRGLGDVQVARGDLRSASENFSEALALARRLADSDPDSARWQGDLVVAVSRLGDVQVAQGDLGSASENFSEALAVARRLAESDPANASWQRDLALAARKLGDLKAAQGDLGSASESFSEALTLTRRLAGADPSNASWQRDLAVALSRLGDVQVAQGNLSSASASYMESLALTRRLAGADPSNASWQRDLAVALSKLGDVQVARRDLVSATASYSEGLALTQRLAAFDPGNASWQWDLAVYQTRLGELQAALGQISAARTSYASSVQILESLSGTDPSNTLVQRALSSTKGKLRELR